MRISLEQALDILMDHVTQGRTERKPLEQCLGLVLSVTGRDSNQLNYHTVC